MTSISRRAIFGIAAAVIAAVPARASSDEEMADMVVIFKSSRKLYLYRDGEPIRRFTIALGWAPEGDKQFEGDGRTPEGTYFIDRLNPNSQFHLSLGISYPDPNDRNRAAAAGVDPGGDIFIHGSDGRRPNRRPDDWTAGCIAVSNAAIEEIWRRVPIGTPIVIQP
ncbi:MAG: L,D-transpeptidase family protein [Rhodobacteraceae bacterium]|nr:L,D-transpeptidase family protein [Paracoccaceae bacterium]